MLREEITYKTDSYVDELGVHHPAEERTEVLWFHFAKFDVFVKELQNREKGGLEGWLKSLQNSTDPLYIWKEFENFLCAAYGERVMDGRAFDKSPEKTDWFKYSKAKEEIILKMMTDPGFAARFINEVWPDDMAETGERIEAARPAMEAALAELDKKQKEEAQVVDVSETVAPKPPMPPGIEGV